MNCDIVENGFTYHADFSHSGMLSCEKSVLDERGVTELWDAPTQADWEVQVECDWLPEGREEALNPTDPELVEEKERFFRTYSFYISHCF